MGFALSRLLEDKRDGRVWSADEIDGLVHDIVDGGAEPSQAGALAMLVRWRGMDADDTASLTRAMASSGTRLAWGAGAPLLDKHSTGGVGDCTSLIVAPLLAASNHIDHRVGLSALRPICRHVEAGEPVAWVHAASVDAADAARRRVSASRRIAAEQVVPPPLIAARID